MSIANKLILAGVLATAACGGNGSAIKHTVPMERLWSVEAAQRGPVAEAYGEMVRLQSELDHTNYLLEDNKREREILEQERARAKIDIKIAKLSAKQQQAGNFEKLAALALGDRDKAKEQKSKLGRRMKWLKAEGRYLSKRRSFLQADLLRAEARFELAKAKLAASAGLAPPGEKVNKYESQLQTFKTRSARRKKAMDEARAMAAAKEKEIGGGS